MDRETTQRLREHYDSTDTSAEMEDGVWESDVDSDPMVTTSLRLPKSVLDQVRDQAATDRVKPTALIRRWVEERLEATPATGGPDAGPSTEDRIRMLEQAVLGIRNQLVHRGALPDDSGPLPGAPEPRMAYMPVLCDLASLADPAMADKFIVGGTRFAYASGQAFAAQLHTELRTAIQQYNADDAPSPTAGPTRSSG